MNQTREARRDQVVEAVIKLIGEHGMCGFTTAAVAREVGMSEANLYRHFKNKQEIMSEIIERIGRGLSGNVEAVVKSCNTPIDRLKNIFLLHLHYVAQNHGIPRLIFSDEIHAENEDMKSRLLDMITAYARLLEAIISEGKKKGSLKGDLDPRATALTFIGMVQVTILRWVFSGFSLAIEKEGLTLWNNFEACLQAKARKKGKFNKRRKEMKRHLVIVAATLAALIMAMPAYVQAHCDTLDGPVVASARAALEKGDVTPVLKWVRSSDEKGIKEIFQKVLTARKSGPDAKAIADMYFFETLVRIHRAGEGAPYTGLKAGPAEPIIAAVDKGLDTGSIDKVVKHVSSAVSDGINKRFNETLELKKRADENVTAGRKFVEAYVDLTHYVERLYNDAGAQAAHGHGATEEKAPKGEHAH